MNIAIVSLGSVSEDTGGRNYLVNFTKALARLNDKLEKKHRVDFFLSPNQQQILAPFLNEQFRVVEVPPASSSSAMKVVSEQLVAPFFIAQSHADVVYFPGNFVSLLSPKPTVVAIRSMLYYHHPEAVDSTRRTVRKLLTPPSAKRSRAIITPSQDIKNDVVNFVGIDEKKIHVVNHGVDTEMFQKNYVESERDAVFRKFGITRKFIVYASALWGYKNQDKLILATDKLIRERGLDIQVVIAGKGIGVQNAYESKLHRLVNEKKLNERVLFTGFLPHEELKYLYKYAEVFAYPSGYESFGNPLFEAWAAGVPVVCANVHSFPEMTENGKCALMVNPLNVDDLTDALHKAIIDDSTRKRLIDAGAARVSGFSWDKAARETLTVLDSVIEKPNR